MQYKRRYARIDDDRAHKHWMSEARRYADCSPDPSTKVGAVLVRPPGVLLGSGYNNFPMGVLHKPERWMRPTKYDYVMHAEAMVLLRVPLAKANLTRLYTTLCPCNECAKLIIFAGVQEVYYPPYEERHYESLKLKITFEMFKEAGVAARCIDDE